MTNVKEPLIGHDGRFSGPTVWMWSSITLKQLSGDGLDPPVYDTLLEGFAASGDGEEKSESQSLFQRLGSISLSLAKCPFPSSLLAQAGAPHVSNAMMLREVRMNLERGIQAWYNPTVSTRFRGSSKSLGNMNPLFLIILQCQIQARVVTLNLHHLPGFM